jgi:hypothetical protein
MNIIERIESVFWRWRYAVAKWQADRRLAKRDLARAKAHGFYQRGVIALTIGFSFTLAACGATATETLRAEARAIGEQCAQHATEIAEAAPTHAEGVAALIAERTRCEAEARAFCSEHDLDCSEVLP